MTCSHETYFSRLHLGFAVTPLTAVESTRNSNAGLRSAPTGGTNTHHLAPSLLFSFINTTSHSAAPSGVLNLRTLEAAPAPGHEGGYSACGLEVVDPSERVNHQSNMLLSCGRIVATHIGLWGLTLAYQSGKSQPPQEHPDVLTKPELRGRHPAHGRT
ncbi:hypothetical protein P153DRAFT_392720 [Dothidotthia symphoricarpi CBS 119687]|uniref:Uncharacterized protein n=1 Tax=Dothidotthia symphoricarpi CBS 119687 TaxID=1392245 RepID=A0A6A6AQA3_9PLEO|nr:uncharacterized protein P153DRAFT_392720 [Dothidotthia symphoricarpi CBS 119687]KAF2134109.1 hypothetical protein P153DRAFT_392720 [Dothidotthia symphoricarpi CBS 119687]